MSKVFAYQSAKFSDKTYVEERDPDEAPDGIDQYVFEENIAAGPTSDTRHLIDKSPPNFSDVLSDFEKTQIDRCGERTGLTLGYWKIRGMAAGIRYQMEYCGVDYQTDDYTDGEKWLEDKHHMGFDFPNLPYLIDVGVGPPIRVFEAE